MYMYTLFNVRRGCTMAYLLDVLMHLGLRRVINERVFAEFTVKQRLVGDTRHPLVLHVHTKRRIREIHVQPEAAVNVFLMRRQQVLLHDVILGFVAANQARVRFMLAVRFQSVHAYFLAQVTQLSYTVQVFFGGSQDSQVIRHNVLL